MTTGVEDDPQQVPQDVFNEPLRRFGADSAELDKLSAAVDAFTRMEWAMARRASAKLRD